MLLQKSREIAQERMKRLSQSENNSSGKDEEAEPKLKQHPVVDVPGDGSKSKML